MVNFIIRIIADLWLAFALIIIFNDSYDWARIPGNTKIRAQVFGLVVVLITCLAFWVEIHHG